MATAKKRPAPISDQVITKKRRSVSTASHDTSTAINSPIEPGLQYAPINTNDYQQHVPYDHIPVGPPSDSHLSGEHASLAQIRQFNDSHGHAIDSNIAPAPSTAGTHIEDTFDQHTAFNVPKPQAAPTAIVAAGQHPALARAASQDIGGGAGTDEEKRSRKQINNNAANEKELRDMIEANAHRSLESIAKDVRGAERTQKAEKAKQLFAMRWLQDSCKQDSESVPRNRVYTQYALQCGSERVDTLNPASFGKLVRIIFPGIQTRRLGVRGESKYHYVNLTLIEDPRTVNGNQTGPQIASGSGDRGTPVDPDASFQNSTRIPTDSATFPQQENSFGQSHVDANANPASRAQLFVEPFPSRSSADKGPALMYRHSLKFSSDEQALLSDAPLTLPSIEQYLPLGTDKDLADALSALYRTHCTSLVDAVRYVKEKQFTKLLGSFNGTMTVPVSRLFGQASLAPWIRECDRVMYQQIIRFVSHLALQVMPVMVFSMLRTISMNLCDHIQRNFRQYPHHVMEAKLEMATIFCSLIRRMLRVNETAHAAANLLMNDDMRLMMWQDWVRSVRPKSVVESSLSRCGHEEAYSILTAEMRYLLAPLPPCEALEQGTEFAESSLLDSTKGEWLSHTYPSADQVMERWTLFLKSLPSRFPNAPTRTLLHCIESVGNASLRDVTVSVAQSFGAWWTTKVWIDEIMLWMAEMGGFLDSNESRRASESRYEDLDSLLESSIRRMSRDQGQQGPDTSNEQQRPNSANPNLDFQNLPSFSPTINGHRHSSGPPTTTFKYSSPNSKLKDHATGLDFQSLHEDSGIGMSLVADGPPSFNDINTSFG